MAEPYSSKKNKKLASILLSKAQRELDKGAKPALDDFWVPDRWWREGIKYRCINDHVSTCVLSLEAGGLKCLECFEWVHYTFPEDEDGPLF